MASSDHGKESPVEVPVGKQTASAPKKQKRSWDESFALLVSYKEKEGHANVPYTYPPDAALSKWVRTQRMTQHQLILVNQYKLLFLFNQVKRF